MKNIGYYNGHFDELDKMVVPMLDRAYYFGDGVYDVAYAVNYDVLFLDEHLERLYINAKLLGINPPIDSDTLKTIILDLVKKIDSGNQQVYFQFSRGTGVREHNFDSNMKANVCVMITEKEMVLQGSVKCITMDDTRYLHCNMKTLNLLPSVLGAKNASEHGVYEVIFHRNGRITECSHSNIHIIKGNKFITAPADNLILPGIGRRHLIELMKSKDYEICETAYYLDDLYNADRVIISAAGTPCLYVNQVDDITYDVDE